MCISLFLRIAYVLSTVWCIELICVGCRVKSVEGVCYIVVKVHSSDVRSGIFK